MTTLADRLAATRNHPTGFDWMRLLLAISIIGWHTISLSYGLGVERLVLMNPLWRPFVLSILGLFFCLSGFLVAGSLERCRTPVSFAGLRILRIFPALVMEVLLSALIIGPLLTHYSLGGYFTDREFRVYFANMIGDVHFVLPGLFPHNPVPHIVNGQIWTVPYELKCYEVLVLISVLRFYKNGYLLVATLAAAIAYVVFQNGFVGVALTGASSNELFILPGNELVLCFLMGVGLFRFRDRVVWSAWLGGGSGVATAILLAPPLHGGLGLSLAPIPLAYLTVYLGLLNPPKIKPLFGGDYSYGLYLYGFPIQQVITSAGNWTHHWYVNFGLALPLAGGVAYFSWTCVERPILSRKVVLAYLDEQLMLLLLFGKLRLRRGARQLIRTDRPRAKGQ